MAWLQLTLPSSQQVVESWSDLLLEAGAVSVSIEDNQQQAIFELTPDHNPIWDNVKLIALFTTEYDPLVIQQQLATAIDPIALSKASWDSLEDEDWVRKSQAFLQPMQFGEKLWICPSWCTPPDPKAINIILDPEQAFGSGSHATTALCLKWITDNILPGNSVVDYGCGSGILAIAAAKFGAKDIYAVDIDPIALEVTKNNAVNNQVYSANFKTYLTDQELNIKSDVVIANILAQPLIGLAPVLASLLKPRGKLVLSGILIEQATAIIERYSSWFKDFEVTKQDDWVRITAILQDH